MFKYDPGTETHVFPAIITSKTGVNNQVVITALSALIADAGFRYTVNIYANTYDFHMDSIRYYHLDVWGFDEPVVAD